MSIGDGNGSTVTDSSINIDLQAVNLPLAVNNGNSIIIEFGKFVNDIYVKIWMNKVLIADTSGEFLGTTFFGSHGFGFGKKKHTINQGMLSHAVWPVVDDHDPEYVQYNDRNFFINSRSDTIDEFIKNVSGNIQYYDSSFNNELVDNDFNIPVLLPFESHSHHDLRHYYAYIIYIQNLNIKPE